MITRDAVQGFIDGHKMAGHDNSCLEACASKWLSEHPQYKPDDHMLKAILADLESYRK